MTPFYLTIYLADILKSFFEQLYQNSLCDRFEFQASAIIVQSAPKSK